MTLEHIRHTHDTKLPIGLILSVWFLSVLPVSLNFLGVDFGTTSTPFVFDELVESSPMTELSFTHLSGAFTHTLLEWSAFCAALFTMMLALVRFTLRDDIIVPIIGVALFCAGCMDAFHTLAADHLIEAVADNQNLIPFTWAICRIFNALILVLGASLFYFIPHWALRYRVLLLIVVSVLFAVIAYTTIHVCAVSERLPQTMFPDSLVKRPWDVLPLLLYLGATLFVIPSMIRHQPSIFANALLLSMVPQIFTQLHTAFGSERLFDNHFNIAHALKIVAYVVPLAGLMLDYIQTYRIEEASAERFKLLNAQLEGEIVERKRAQTSLEESAKQLKKLATRDALTGLRNRGEFDRLLDEEIQRSARSARPLCLYMIDIDHFKNVNDTLGHQSGDEALRHVAQKISNIARTTDHITRYGGEEFAIISPDTPSQEALVLAERLRQHIEEHPCRLTLNDGEAHTLSLTVSIGVSEIPGNASTRDALVQTADAALYRAKEAGRNRVERCEIADDTTN